MGARKLALAKRFSKFEVSMELRGLLVGIWSDTLGLTIGNRSADKQIVKFIQLLSVERVLGIFKSFEAQMKAPSGSS